MRFIFLILLFASSSSVVTGSTDNEGSLRSSSTPQQQTTTTTDRKNPEDTNKNDNDTDSLKRKALSQTVLTAIRSPTHDVDPKALQEAMDLGIPKDTIMKAVYLGLSKHEDLRLQDPRTVTLKDDDEKKQQQKSSLTSSNNNSNRSNNTNNASGSNTTVPPLNTTETPPALPLLKTKEQLLKAVVSLLNERGVPYFIMYGTLLGQMRDGGLIPHENDIDALLPMQHAPEFVAALRNLTNMYGNVVVRDWSLLGIVQVTTDPQHAKIPHPNKPRKEYLLMDTYVFNRTKGLVVEKWNKLIFNETQFYPAQTMNFHLNETHENITVQVPAQPSVLIDKLYGPDWLIPYKDNRGKQRKSPYCGAGAIFGKVWKNCY